MHCESMLSVRCVVADLLFRFVAVEKGFGQMVHTWLTKCPEDIDRPCSSVGDNLPPLAVSVMFHQLAMSQLLLDRGAQVDVLAHTTHLTPLHLAILNDDIAAMQLFLHHHADLYRCNVEAKSAFYFIMERGLLDALHLFRRYAKDDFNVNGVVRRNGDGNKCLHIAAIRNHPHMVSILLCLGADIDAVNAEGKTALEMATAFRCTEAETALMASKR